MQLLKKGLQGSWLVESECGLGSTANHHAGDVFVLAYLGGGSLNRVGAAQERASLERNCVSSVKVTVLDFLVQ